MQEKKIEFILTNDVGMKWLSLYALIIFILVCSTAWCEEIHEAAKCGNIEIVKCLLKENPVLIHAKDIH